MSEPGSSVVGDGDDDDDGDASAQQQDALSPTLTSTSLSHPHSHSHSHSLSISHSAAGRARPAVEDVLASIIPGARLPSARDREQPPPSYVPVPPAGDVSLVALAGAGGAGRRLTVMDEDEDGEE